MISQRAWLVGVVGFCFYLITIVNDLPSFYYALTWLAAGVLGSSMGIAVLSLIGLRCAWRAQRDVVTENFSDDANGPIIDMQLANAGTLNKTGVLVEVRLQRVSDEQHFARRFLLEALPSGSSVLTALPLRHLRRGRYRVLEVRLIGSDVLGLFSIRKRIAPGIDFESVLSKSGPVSLAAKGRDDQVVVGPAALARGGSPLAPTQLARGDGGVPVTRLLGQGEDIRGTRLYAPGDDLRHVHWKSTGRKGQLVVKEFHHTLQEQTFVVWDGVVPPNQSGKVKGNDSAPSPRFDIGFNACEWSLRLSASLCRALVENRRPCALLRLDASPLALGISEGAQPAAISMNQVSEVLADAHCNRETTVAEAFAPWRARCSGGEVFIVTTLLSDQLIALAKQLRVGGARVSIALVDFELPPADAFRKNDPKRLLQRSAAAAREQEYLNRLQALRESGARLVTLKPTGKGRNFMPPILAAVHAMLEPGVERPQPETERRELENVGR